MPQSKAILPGAVVAALANKAGLDSDHSLVIAVAVAHAESSFDCLVTHKNLDGSIDYGLWQINSVHGFDPKELLNPGGNAVAMAKVSSTGRNWTPWVAFSTGRYLQFMPAATQSVKNMRDNGADKTILDNVDKFPAGTVTSGPGNFFSGVPGAGSIGGAIDSAKSAAQGIADFTSTVGDFVGKVTDPHTWYRIGQVLLGAIFLFLGLYMLTKGGMPDPRRLPRPRRKTGSVSGDTFEVQPA